jgi:hypothetical protein
MVFLDMKFRIILFILPLFLAGCHSISRIQNDNSSLNWNYEDLRLLDGIDATEPDQDLIALYTRDNNQSFQIRLDFLDVNTYLRKDIYIPLDTNPGGTLNIKTKKNGTITSDINWDYLIIIPDSGNIIIVDDHLSPISGMQLFIVYDSSQDMMVISFNKSVLPLYYGQTKLQVIITPANQNVVSDKSEPFLLDSPPPPRGKVLFAFWNTFSSITPAQTLRSWTGAHTGPLSSRHGLRYLLDAAAQTKSTVFLLDLLTPDTLSALDYLNALPRLRRLADQGILALPGVGNVTVLEGTNEISPLSSSNNQSNNSDFYKVWKIDRNVKNKYLTNNSDFIVLMNKYELLNSKFLMISNNDYAKFLKINNGCELFPFYTNYGSATYTSDLSIDCKTLLLTYAISHPTTPLILGGDFSKSILGNSYLSTEVFSYIRAHPWLQTLTISDILSSPELISDESTIVSIVNKPQTVILGKTSLPAPQNKIYTALLQSPKNLLTDLAWRMFSNLTQPDSPELINLRSSYIGQIGDVLTAANWEENPIPLETCNIDLDYDGFSECILANNTVFAIIEPDGGYMPFVFAKDAQGIHQIIGPTWEFIVGLSDVSSWNPDLGVRGDSAQILGAFQDPFDNWRRYSVNLTEHKLEIYNDNMGMHKLINILPDSLHVEILSSIHINGNSYIPLVIDPWFRYTSGWGNFYIKKSESFNVHWGITSGEMVEIRSTNPLNMFSFNDTRAALSYPEDPNYDYMRGHYLPFPMSVAEISPTENYSIDIAINP